MKAFDLQRIVRPHITTLKPYSSARDEYAGTEGIFLDANENPLGATSGGPYNRYPDPLQLKVKEKLARLKHVSPSQIFLGNGSDEAIDLLFRAFTVPGKDNVIILPPTYGMYEVSASINDVAVKRASLTADYQIIPEQVLAAVDPISKIIFICSPNNPTGNLVSGDAIIEILENFSGLVVVDEAYIDFAEAESNISLLKQYNNLIVLQTFSKAWGLAALRLGVAYASSEIISILNKIKPPYNVTKHSQETAAKALDAVDEMREMVKEIVSQRESLARELKELALTEKVYPSDANFLLVKVKDARQVYRFLVDHKVIVRDRSTVTLCENSLRITVGSKEENAFLINTLKNYPK